MNKEYPKHVYEPIRIRAAREIIQKELIKLFPSVSKNLWPEIAKDVRNWFNGEKSELASVHDFWNGFEGITQGFKLKGILCWLTAENIRWREKTIPVNKIIFSTDLPILSFLAKVPFKAQLLIDFIKNSENWKKFLEIRCDSDFHSRTSFSRDDYRILVVQNKKGYYELLDGHRRVIRKIVYHKKIIKAYVGKFTTKSQLPKNYWVSTGFMRNLVRIANENNHDKKIIKAISVIINSTIKKYDNMKYLFSRRVRNKINKNNKLIKYLDPRLLSDK